MYYKNLIEVANAIAEEYDLNEHKIILTSVTDYCAIAVFYKDQSLIDGVTILLTGEERWEIIRGNRARETAYIFMAFFTNLIELCEEREELSDFDASKLFE